MADPLPTLATRISATPRARCALALLALLAVLLGCTLAPAAEAAAPQRSSFDHLTTGFELLGQHRDLPCESCHANAIFKGTPKTCSACHGVGTTVRATAKPTSHMLSTDQCDSCHSEVAWKPAVTFDHKQALGSCSSCHNGVQAQGKPPNHIVTDLECDACHTTVSWIGATFTHVGVTGNCAECHNNVSATGMPSNHMPIGTPPTPCEACHSNTNFTNWLGATINHPAVSTMLCATCHETANYLGMHPSTNTTAADSRPNATLDKIHPTTGDCGQCHDTTSFSAAANLKPTNHIPTTAPCTQCHTTPGNYTVYSVTGVHQGVTTCLSCHGAGVGPFANVTVVTMPGNHIPIGSLDCNGSGCHTTTYVNPGGFKIGAGSAGNTSSPTLNIAGHQTVSAAVAGCNNCHETAPYVGMIAGTAGAWGDSRPTNYDPKHPLPPADCGGCHTTTPTFSSNQLSTALPTGHVPIAPPTYAAQPACATCHTFAGDFSQYSVSAVHQGANGCAACHGPGLTFLNVTPLPVPGNHFPIGSGATAVDCNGGGCHSANGGAAGGFKIGAASPTGVPTLSVPGHTTVAAGVSGCAVCHEAAQYLGMMPSSSGAWGDSRPMAYDPNHPSQTTAPECGTCHTTAPTFANNMTGGSLPANHIPIAPPVYPAQPACTTCHMTPNNYAQYSVSAVHTGVTTCNACHASNVNTTFKNVTMVTTPANHIPIGAVGALDCNGSGCHVTNGGATGGFKIGVGAAPTTNTITSPTLNVAGHVTVQAVVALCATCHEGATSAGMVASSNTAAGDSRPNSTLDANHPTSGDCGTCHVTTPTFNTNELCGTKALPACTAAIPPNHIPTTSVVCGQCHTTAGNFAVYDVVGVHQGQSTCNQCHGSSAGTLGTGKFLGPPPSNVITVVGWPGSPPHFPAGTLDCGSSGCHTTSKVNPGGFKIGAPNISSPTLNVVGHATVAAAVGLCQTCHESAGFSGMLVGASMSAMGDDRPTKYDGSHPTSGDCNGCHSTTPIFATNQSGNAKPANHIPTGVPPYSGTAPACATCHTTAGNYAAYSVAAVHSGVTACRTCHASNVASTFANVTIVTTPGNHIPTGNADCNGSGCHVTNGGAAGGFKIGAAVPATPTLTVAGHTTIANAGVSGCAGCHESAPYLGMMASTAGAWADSRPTAYDKSHPTAAQGPECSTCHTTTPTFNNNQTGSAKPANHIPTGVPPYSGTAPACATCHTTVGNNAVYSVAAVHTGVTACAVCHGSSVANTFANVTIVTTPANHIPFGSADCNGSGCHAANGGAAGGFKIGTAAPATPTLVVAGHTTVANAGVKGCAGCHETAPYVGMKASTAAAWADSRPMAYDKNHPSSGECNGCHTTTPTFFTNQSGTSAKPANHIPTNAACAQCHTTAGNYGAYVMGATGHTGITSNCAQCHAYGLSFYNMAPPTLVEPPAGATGHIPSVPPNSATAIACELCHSPSVFTTFSGTVMKHAYVTAMKCDSCHEYGMTWKVNSNLWTRPSPNHHAGQDCGGSGCHSSRDVKFVARGPVARAGTTTTTTTQRSAGTAPVRSTGPVARAAAASLTAPNPATIPAAAAAAAIAAFSHVSVAGTACVSCHSAASGSAKPASHIATSNACQNCHTTLSWLPVTRVDHTQVLGTCASCHNGTTATGKPSSHLPTTGACDSCHTTTAWTPARFDHAAITPHSCTTCHNAVRAIGLPRAHIPTTQQCDSCHGTLAWSPVKVDHAHLTASCASCHNNVGAVGFSPGHLHTKVDCARCHSYPDWSAVTFRHVSSAFPAGRHTKLACTSCHTTNTDQVPYASAADAGTCAGCHAKDFKPAAHPKTAKGVSYSAHELADCTGACHVYSDTTQSTITRSLPGPHHRVTDATLKR